MIIKCVVVSEIKTISNLNNKTEMNQETIQSVNQLPLWYSLWCTMSMIRPCLYYLFTLLCLMLLKIYTNYTNNISTFYVLCFYQQKYFWGENFVDGIEKHPQKQVEDNKKWEKSLQL